jgi:hypothetical protein
MHQHEPARVVIKALESNDKLDVVIDRRSVAIFVQAREFCARRSMKSSDRVVGDPFNMFDELGAEREIEGRDGRACGGIDLNRPAHGFLRSLHAGRASGHADTPMSRLN